MARELSRQDVQTGITVRLLRDYLRVPAGTLATVETVHSGRNWHFTVRWKSHSPITGAWRPQQGHRIMPMECSLNLSEEDLKSFEIATDQELLSPQPPFELTPLEREDGQDVAQLRIPFADG